MSPKSFITLFHQSDYLFLGYVCVCVNVMYPLSRKLIYFPNDSFSISFLYLKSLQIRLHKESKNKYFKLNFHLFLTARTSQNKNTSIHLICGMAKQSIWYSMVTGFLGNSVFFSVFFTISCCVNETLLFFLITLNKIKM